MNDPSEPRLEHIKVSELTTGPIRHEALSPELLREMKHLYGVVGPTLEQWEVGFMRDAHPEREVGVWKSVAKAFVDYRNLFLGGKQLRDSEAEAIVGALSAISMGITDASSLKLPERMAARLVECFRKTIFGAVWTEGAASLALSMSLFAGSTAATDCRMYS